MQHTLEAWGHRAASADEAVVYACLPHPVPTYILTGDTSPQRIREASLLGFPLLHKPVNAQTLRNILDTEAIAHSTLA